MRLESKRLYKGCCLMISRVTWEFPTPETEWINVGLGDEFDTQTVQEAVNGRFDDAEILQVIDQRHAGPISTADAASLVQENLKSLPVILCDKNFQSFIYFDPKGLMRQGSISFG